MDSRDLIFFYRMKALLGQVYASRFPGAPGDIRSLSGPDLQRFQDDLMEVTQNRVSEKWFYTHIKPATNEKLPRVDVLNLLSLYLGYEHWPAFRDAQASLLASEAERPQQPGTPVSNSRRRPDLSLWWTWALALIPLLLIGWALMPASVPPAHTICFTDAVLGTAIRDSSLQVWQWLETESPVLLSPNAEGCVEVARRGEQLVLIASLPYYQTDTFRRSWDALVASPAGEQVALHPDDFANLLRASTSWTTEDRLKRRQQLQSMIDPGARILRMSFEDRAQAVELYNREEFIRYLLLFGAGKLEVHETRYSRGLLQFLRFTVLPDPSQ